MKQIDVITYSGYRGEETPRAFKWRGTRVEVSEIKNRWTEQGVGNRDIKRGFDVIGKDRMVYSLIYDEQTGEWSCERKDNDV